MRENRRNLKEQEKLIQEAKDLLEERTARKQEIQKQDEDMYIFMHHLFGRGVLEIFDEFDENAEIEE